MAIKFQGFTGGGGAATGGLTYKGTFNATAGTPDISNALQGDLYVISVAGTIYGQTWAVNDHLLINADMGGVIDNAKIDKIDNTSDTALQIGNNLNDLGDLATAQGNLNLKTAAYEDVGTTAGDVVQLDGTGRLPAVDGSQLTNLPSALVDSVNGQTGAVNIYADDSTLNIDGTALTLSGTGATSTLNVDVGTTANKVVQLDGSARLPAVDGSQLTNLPSAPVDSVNGATGAVNIYADDTTLNIDGTALVLSGTGATSTLNVDVGTTANKIVQLDGAAKIPAVDGSQLTNLPFTGLDVSTVTGAAINANINQAHWITTLGATSVTLTLPISSGVVDGDTVVATRIRAGELVIAQNGSDGGTLVNYGTTQAASVALQNNYQMLTIRWNGSAWYIFDQATGTAANEDVGTTAGDVVQLDGSARLPAVDGSQLTNLPSAPVDSVNGATGAVNIYADDATLNIDGTALVLSGTGATSTLNVDVGTTANKIVQLDGTARLPAVDGSQLTNLPSAPVTSVNGKTGVVTVDVLDDTTPQLGGNLDVNGQSIVSVSNGDINIAPDGTGIIKTTGSIEPDADLTRTIGTEALRYLTAYTDIDGAIRFKAKNDSGGLMTKGQVVYIKGISGSVPTVALARSNSALTMPAFGLVHASANDQAEVTIITLGSLYDVDTTTYSLGVGDTVYVSSATAGALTNSPPTGESNLIQNIGKVVRADASAGIIKVGGAGRSAATPNLDTDKIFLGDGSNQAVSTALSAINLSSFNQDLTTTNVSEGTNQYFTTGRVDTQVATLPMSTLSDVAYTPGAGIDNYVLTYDHSTTSWGAEAASGGGARPSVTDITATPYTIGTTDSAIGASELERTYVCSSSAATVNLPTAVGLEGFKLQIKSLLATTVTIDPDGTEYIDHAGQTTFNIATQYTSITLQSDNANWVII